MFARIQAWSYAVKIARSHVVNWPEQVLKAVSGQVAFSCNSFYSY
jgi:hypothetical protein